MKKTNIARSTGKFLEKSVERNVLRAPSVDRAGLIRDIVELETRVRTSISEGHVEYASPASLGRLEGYANRYAMPVVRGMYAWNAVSKDNPIREGDRVNLFKCRIGTNAVALEEEMSRWPEESAERNAFLALVEAFFDERAPEGLVTNGLNWLAVPKDVKELPAWARAIVNVDEVAAVNTSPIYPILEAVGVKLLKASGDLSYSNIIAF